MTTVLDPSTRILAFDDAKDALLGTDVRAGIVSLHRSLRQLRSSLPADDWKSIGDYVRTHPVHRLLLESPFSRRAFTKPRGYAGDAGLMDLIYRRTPDIDMSALGAMLYAFEFDTAGFHGVRTRRALLAREIDIVSARCQPARVIAVACGHLREIELSRAVRYGRASVLAIDQDETSLDLIRHQYSAFGVQPMAATVRDLIRRPAKFGPADLVYAAGLYDYLEEPVARALTAALFRMLSPGGRLLIANFTPDIADAGFMEAILDWHLIYRTGEQVRALAAAIAPEAISAIEQFSDDHGCIAYLRVVKR